MDRKLVSGRTRALQGLQMAGQGPGTAVMLINFGDSVAEEEVAAQIRQVELAPQERTPAAVAVRFTGRAAHGTAEVCPPLIAITCIPQTRPRQTDLHHPAIIEILDGRLNPTVPGLVRWFHGSIS